MKSFRSVGESSFGSSSRPLWHYLSESSRREGIDPFSDSSWREGFDDSLDCPQGESEEERQKWAALKRLPTHELVKRGILIDGGKLKEVDVRSLDPKERKNHLERLVREKEEDNETFLRKLRYRMNMVGIEIPTVEVRFENLNVDAQVYVGKRGVPTFINYFTNKIEEALHYLHIIPTRKRTLSILHDTSGVVKPCRMTLLLGPPGSGKTTLLLALAGKLNPKLKVSGRVTYNGHGMDEFVPQRNSSYISQHDVHIAQMTVRETLAFAAICQGVGSRYEMLMELLRREKASNIKPDPEIDLYMKASSLKGHEGFVTDYILKILGLEECADTMIGDAMVRGVSGGEKKRVTIGEMLVGPAKAFLMDEISTGLDSSTTFKIIKSIQQYVHILGGTALIALLQPAPETYELFDDIILQSDGQIVYQGPREYVVEYFESMGFRCPMRKGVGDFLQEVTSRKDQQQYWMHSSEAYHFVSAKEFAEAFQSFHVGQRLQHELKTPFDKSKNHVTPLATSRYGAGKMELLKACMSREYLLMKRNSIIYMSKVIEVILVGSVTMTIFLRTKMHHDTIEDGDIYMGVLYFGIIVHMFNGFAELAMSVAKLPIFYKQRNLLFYPAWAYAVPAWVLKIPISLVDCVAWVAITYYTVGFDPSVQRMFKQYLVFVLVSQMAFSLFRLSAAVGRTMVTAFILGVFALVILQGLGGFNLSKNNVKKWWVWGYWSSPMMYATNAIAVNEFLGKKWAHDVNLTNTDTIGVQVLRSRGLFPESYWYWIGIGGLVGFILLFNGLTSLALAYLDSTGKGQTILSEEALNGKNSNRTGEYQKPSPMGNSSGNKETSRAKSDTDATQEKKRGMSLPFIPLSITFEEIKYSIDMPMEMKVQGRKEDRLLILNGLNGAFRPGVLTAIMGISGAGKTTLLDVLAGRKTGGHIEGSIKISGYPKKQETFARISGYCEQNDIHSPHVTVYESLQYSAGLRLAPEVDSATRKMFIEEVMELVELTALRDAIVGLPEMSGLSTEQRKRLTVAVELVANPSIIFMDEPTTGLDARAAAIVMRTVRNTVDTGRTVVCTIHQPSTGIFEAFDELLLMKQGGGEIYVGPIGQHSCNLIKYFECIKGVTKIKDGYNPSTWMLDITAKSQEERLGINFAEIYKKSDLFRRNKALVDELCTPSPTSKELYFPTQYPQSFVKQCVACLWKQHKSYWRNPEYTATRIFFTTIVALMLGTMYWGLGSKMSTRQDLLNMVGLLYCVVIFIGIPNAQIVQPIVDVERKVFYREKAAGMYSALTYAYAQVMIEVPYIFLQTVIVSFIVYTMVNFKWQVARFFWFFFFLFSSYLSFTLYGMVSVAITPNANAAAVASTMFYALWNLFSGFITPRTRIPIWWSWYYWACPLAWAIYGLLTSQYGDIKDLMETGESVEGFLRRYFGFKHEFLGAVAGVMLGFNLLFGFVFAYAIKSLNFQKR